MKEKEESMKMILLLASMAFAQNDADVQNINQGLNPTAAARLPSTYIGQSPASAPTYPSGSNMPAWRGGSVGQDDDKEDKQEPGIQARDRYHRRDQRRAAEPNS